MEQRVLAIENRDKVGKGICRRLRSKGMVPAVVYGKGIESVPVTVESKALLAAIAGEGGINHLISLKGTALDGNYVIIADMLCDCIKGDPLHVDFHRVTLDELVKVHVPVRLKGTAKGIKEGGVLDFHMHNLEVECLPMQIPDHLDIDVTKLEIGKSLHVSDLGFMPGLKFLDDPSAAVVSVTGKATEAAATDAE